MRTAEQTIQNKIVQARWTKKHPEVRRAIQQRYSQSPKGIYRHIIKRTINTNVQVASQADFIAWYLAQVKECAYCNLPESLVALRSDNKMRGCKRLTIDRKDPAAGYLTDNLALACPTCNFLKSDLFTYDEMKEIGLIINRKWSQN